MSRRGWLGRLLGLGHRTRNDSEAELRFHVEERIDRLVAEGWSPEDARREVERRFGDFEATLDAVQRVERQRVRRGRVRGMFDTIGRTVAATGRMVLRSPAYALTVVLTLALGLGASTAMFSVLYGALLRPLPYPEPDQLVRVHNRFEATGGSGPFSIPNFLDVREQSRAFQAMAGYQGTSVTLADETSSERIGGLRVTANFLDALGVAPTMGRSFTKGEDREGADRTVILTHELWSTRFVEDPEIVGREIRIDDRPHTVIGILPESFWFPGDPRLLVPFSWDEEDTADAGRGNRSLSAIARIGAGGATPPEVLARELTAITDRIAESHPDNQEGWVVTVEPFREYVFARSRTSVYLLSGAVGLLLLIACVNVANLMLVRGERRARETAVRAALGAGRGTLVGESLVHSLSLAAIAGLIGLGLAYVFTDLLLALYGDSLPRAESIGLNLPVLAAALGLVVVTGIAVGMIPVLRLRMRRLQEILRGGGRGEAAAANRIQRFLVVGQVALAVILVTGSALLIQSFRNLNAVDAGVDPERALTFTTQISPLAYPSGPERQDFFERAVERIGSLPGVEAVGISELTPLQGGWNITSLPSPDDPELEAAFVELRRVSPDFFRAAGIDLVRGRTFEPSEYGGGSAVVVISDELARTIFPDGEVLGKRILPDWWNEVGYEVVGVVESVREFGVEREPRPAVYWPFGETAPPARMTFVVRTASDEPLDVFPGIRAAMAELDPAAPLFGVRSMKDVVVETMGERVFTTSLFMVFGAAALLLAGIGVFSVLAYLVEQRTREIGIRLALGSSRSAVQRLVAREATVLAGVGLVVGGAVALLSTSTIEGMLYGVSANDPLVLGVVAAVAAAGAAVAAWLPARRATRVDPMIAMREE